MMSQPTQRRVARALRAGGPEVIEVGVEELPPLRTGEAGFGANSGRQGVRLSSAWLMNCDRLKQRAPRSIVHRRIVHAELPRLELSLLDLLG